MAKKILIVKRVSRLVERSQSTKQMKRINNLYEQIISIDNLQLAAIKARKGKEKQKGVMMFDKNKEYYLNSLHEVLKSETYKTSTYTVFTIYEPKERIIYRLPFFPDRIVHHAIMNILEPIWTKILTYNTYSCIKGRGISACANRVDKIIKSFKDKKLYCLKIDIKKFYPNIDNDILKQIIRKKIKDKRTLKLLDEIIDSERGLPIGNYLSQFLANIYLAYFMHYCNEVLKVKCTEYADDICFYNESKQRLHEVFKKIKTYLDVNLKLQIKDNYQIFPIAENRNDRTGRALDYVGFRFFRRQKLIRKSIKQNFCRNVAKALTNKSLTLENFKKKIASWLGWAKHSNSRYLLHKILKGYEKSIL